MPRAPSWCTCTAACGRHSGQFIASVHYQSINGVTVSPAKQTRSSWRRRCWTRDVPWQRLNTPLHPQVRTDCIIVMSHDVIAASMTTIVDQVCRAVLFVHTRFPTMPIALAGHSAGGHLAVSAAAIRHMCVSLYDVLFATNRPWCWRRTLPPSTPRPPSPPTFEVSACTAYAGASMCQ